MERILNSGSPALPRGELDQEGRRRLASIISRNQNEFEDMSEDEQIRQIEAWKREIITGQIHEEDKTGTSGSQVPQPSFINDALSSAPTITPDTEFTPQQTTVASVQAAPRPESFVFYESFFNAIKNLPKEYQMELFIAICEYGLYRKPPVFKESAFRQFVEAIWESIRPSMDVNYQRRLNGLRGGSPKGPRPAMTGNQNARKKPNQQQPKQNQNKTKLKPYVYGDVHEDENVKKDNLSFPFLSPEFIRAWTVLREQPNWKKKSNHALQLSLNKLAQFPEAFAIHLIQEATERGWTGVVFDSTPEAFQKWKQSHSGSNEDLITSVEDLYK